MSGAQAVGLASLSSPVPVVSVTGMVRCQKLCHEYVYRKYAEPTGAASSPSVTTTCRSTTCGL